MTCVSALTTGWSCLHQRGNDQLRQENVIVIVSGQSEVYPMTLLRRFLATAKGPWVHPLGHNVGRIYSLMMELFASHSQDSCCACWFRVNDGDVIPSHAGHHNSGERIACLVSKPFKFAGDPDLYIQRSGNEIVSV